jgi:SpoVK/Ycf46/Vps4 family AAA+-type ATPase
MSVTEQKMTSTDAIVRMVTAVNNDNDADFYKALHEYADTLAMGGGNRGRILNAIRLKPMKLRRLDDMPTAIKRLLIQAKNEADNVFLTDAVNSFIETLLVEWRNAEVYRLHNISPRNKILLYGPTGNGKTTIARYIARKTELPFVEINSDLMIDSHLGATAANIHNVLNTLNEPCILFWDEVDTIGAKRGSDGRSADRENDRMVNSILVNIEKLDSQVIFIGATNRMDMLDSAFLRRFDVKLEIPLPSEEEKVMYTQQLLDYYKLSDQLPFPESSKLSCFSEIKLHITQLSRQYLLQSLKPE